MNLSELCLGLKPGQSSKDVCLGN
jgi:hypothetical protein